MKVELDWGTDSEEKVFLSGDLIEHTDNYNVGMVTNFYKVKVSS